MDDGGVDPEEVELLSEFTKAVMEGCTDPENIPQV